MTDGLSRGIHTALVTPFSADGAVDLDAYRALCKRQIDAGIHGLVACGTTGEAPTLTDEEHTSLVSAALEVAAGRVPVTAGIGTNNTRTSVARAHAARSAGADAGLLVFPYYNKPNPDGLRAHVRAVAEVGLPLVLYHVPGRTGQRVPEALLAELACFDGVVAVKEATGDLVYVGALVAATRTPILSGDDFTFLPLMSLGGTGCISVVSNVAPARTVAVYDSFQGGRNGDAAAQMQGLLPLVRFLFSDTNPVPCKAALAAMGLCRADTRLPLAAYKGTVPPALLEGMR